jgi:hypothetical protein
MHARGSNVSQCENCKLVATFSSRHERVGRSCARSDFINMVTFGNRWSNRETSSGSSAFIGLSRLAARGHLRQLAKIASEVVSPVVV